MELREKKREKKIPRGMADSVVKAQDGCVRRKESPTSIDALMNIPHGGQ